MMSLELAGGHPENLSLGGSQGENCEADVLFHRHDVALDYIDDAL